LVEHIQIGDYTVDSIEDNIAYKAKTPVSPQEAFNAVYNNPLTAEQWELEQMLPICSQVCENKSERKCNNTSH